MPGLRMPARGVTKRPMEIFDMDLPFELTADQLFSPGQMVGHLSYVLLVLSMMMRQMTWLRIIAVSAGLTSAAYGFFWLRDPVTVFWEIVFVATNLVQLTIIAYENRKRAFTDEEQIVVDAMVPGVDMRYVRRLLKLGAFKEAPAETELTTQGRMVDELVLITRGTVQVEKDGRIVGACGEGDFIGEISFLSKDPATATVLVTNPVHYMAFDCGELRGFLNRHPELGRAVEASFNRNLMAKLVRTSHAVTQGGDGDGEAQPAAT